MFCGMENFFSSHKNLSHNLREIMESSQTFLKCLQNIVCDDIFQFVGITMPVNSVYL